MQPEKSYNPDSSDYASIYRKLKHFADNPLVKQFTVKSLNEIQAAEHSFRAKMKELNVKNEKAAEKYALYEGVLETLDQMAIQCIYLSADLLFESTGQTIETTDAVIVSDEKEVKSKLDIVKSPKEEKKKEDTPVVNAETDTTHESVIEPIVTLPKEPIEDSVLRSTMHEVIKKGESEENLVDWLKQMVEKELFTKGSRILGTLQGKDDERYIKYVKQMLKNPATGPQEKTEPKSEVTEIPLPEEPISFNRMKEEVKKAFKDYVDEKIVDTYVLAMINKKLIKGGADKVKTKKERLGWELNVKKGVETGRKKQAEIDKAAAKLPKEDAPIEEILPDAKKEEEDNGAPQELLTACQSAENELKAGNRDKAIGIIKHYLGEYGGDPAGAFTDLDIHALLNWIDEDVFHHRNPMDILHKIPLSLTDVIKEVEKQVKSALTEDGKLKEESRKDISDLIFSKVEGVKMREMKSMDDVIRDKEEFDKWFASNCGFVFQSKELEGTLDKQAKFEQDFENTIRETKPEKANIFSLLREYKKRVEEFGTELDLNDALKIVVSKLATLNPALKKAYDESRKKNKKEPTADKATAPLALPEAAGDVVNTEDTKAEEDGSSKEDDFGKGQTSVKEPKVSGPEPLAEVDPKLLAQSKKLNKLEGLTNFILKNPKVGSVGLFGLAKRLITSGQITDAVTKFDEEKEAVPWDQQQISNWFRLGPALILESIDVVTAKTTNDLKSGIRGFIRRNPSLEQEDVLTKISELMEMPSAVQSKHVRKQIKLKDFKLNLQKLYEQVLEENHVQTT